MSESERELEPEVGGGVLPGEGFRAELDVFSGPLDLLLHLVRRSEVDVLEIPLSHLTDQYLQVVRTMQVLEVNVAAEFLVMAATLLEIKSRSLLPQETLEEEGGDPRDELVHQLLQYKRFRELAATLEACRRRQALKYARPPAPVEEDEPEPPTPAQLLKDVSIWDLVSAYAEVVRQIELHQPAQIIYDEVPVSAYAEEIMARLAREGERVSFLSLFEGDSSRRRLIGMFLALLELVRQRAIVVEQAEEEKSQILIAAAPPGSREPEPGAEREDERAVGGEASA